MFWLLLAACSPPGPPDILLVTLDTTRADALGAYGRSPSPTPNLDALADRGLRVEEAMSVTPLTLPAHASMLTGLYPDAHGVRDNLSTPMSDDVVTVPERLREGGWHTGAFVGAVVVDSIFGLDQGFEAYEDGFDLTATSAPDAAVVQWPADHVRDAAEKWIGSLPDDDRPFFAWVHFYDAHMPRAVPERFAGKFGDDYHAEVAFADEQLGLLLDAIGEARGDRELVVLVSGDHGEGLGEHAERLHGTFVYRSTMAVPMIAAGPGFPQGSTTKGPRTIVDVGATILDVAGMPQDGLDGVSLTKERTGPVYGETYHPRWQYGLAELRVWQDERYRYILAPQPELYDWKADPGELHDLLAQSPGDAESRKDALLSFLEMRAVGRAAVAAAAGPDADTKAALASLGYLEGAALVGDDVPYDQLPDPKSRPDMVERFEAVVVSARTRPPAEAVPILEAFLAENPGVGGARMLLATAKELSGDPVGAREALKPLIDARPDDPGLRVRDAELLMAIGSAEEAQGALDAVLAKQPDYATAYAVKGELARRRGDCATAIAEVEKGLAYAPESSRLRLVRGACRHSRGDLVGAESDLLAVLKADPRDHDASFLLGLVYARQGRVDLALPYLEAQHQRTPDDPLVQAALGMAYYASGRYPEALPLLTAAAPNAGVGEEPPILLADTILRTGGALADAEAWLAVGEARAPGSPLGHRVRSALLMEKGDVQGALAEMAKAHGN
jgi:choline-sulfatase